MMARSLVLVVAAGLAGCLSSSDEPRPPVPDLATTPRGIACTELARELCARVESCSPFLAQSSTGVGSSCTSEVFDHCFRTAGLGGSNRTIGDLSSCAGNVRGMECTAFLSRFPDVCDAPPGALADGSPCAFPEQCASRFCAREPDTACGTCSAAPQAGQPCAGDLCATGLTCNTAKLCVKPGALGEACGPSEPCERLLFCDANRCSARRKLGETCNGFGQCDAFSETTCAFNSICRSTPIGEEGAACNLAVSDLALCRAPARCIDGRCARGKVEGAACSSSGECAGFLAECVRGRCLLRTVEMCQK